MALAVSGLLLPVARIVVPTALIRLRCPLLLRAAAVVGLGVRLVARLAVPVVAGTTLRVPVRLVKVTEEASESLEAAIHRAVAVVLVLWAATVLLTPRLATGE